jgi:hypothetical protein
MICGIVITKPKESNTELLTELRVFEDSFNEINLFLPVAARKQNIVPVSPGKGICMSLETIQNEGYAAISTGMRYNG